MSSILKLPTMQKSPLHLITFFFYISVLPADSLILLQQAGISHKIYSLNCGTHEGYKENNEFKQSRSKTYPAGSG